MIGFARPILNENASGEAYIVRFSAFESNREAISSSENRADLVIFQLSTKPICLSIHQFFVESPQFRGFGPLLAIMFHIAARISKFVH
jgi:hypothetical protein